MKTEFAAAFAYLSGRKRNPPTTGGTISATVQHIRETGGLDVEQLLLQSATSRAHLFLNHFAQLHSATAIGLMLSDVVVLTGGGYDFDEPNPERAHLGGFLFAMPHLAHLMPKHELDHSEQDLVWGLASAMPTAVERWADDAEALLVDGRVIYLPLRVIFHFEKGKGSMEEYPSPLGGLSWDGYRGYSVFHSWSTWAASSIEEPPLETVTVSMHARTPEQRANQLLQVAVPYLASVPLPLLHSVMRDEYDSLVLFRKALHSSAKQLTDGATTLSRSALAKNAAELRRDVVDPELAKLNLTMRRIVRSRALQVAGATIGSASLVGATVATSGLAAGVFAGLSAAGAGVVVKEVASAHGELMSQRENPWYFAWQLQRRAPHA